MAYYFLLLQNHIELFTFNLLPLLYIIPSDVLPITHVLYIHNRIYARVATSKKVMVQNESGRRDTERNKVMVRMSNFHELSDCVSGTDSLIDVSGAQSWAKKSI